MSDLILLTPNSYDKQFGNEKIRAVDKGAAL